MSELQSTANISVQLPDGSIREVAAGTTPLEIANAISPRLAAAVVVARIRLLTQVTAGEASDSSEESMYAGSTTDTDGTRLVDLSTPLTESVELWLLKEQ